MTIYLTVTSIFGFVLTATLLIRQLIFGERIKMNKRVNDVVGPSPTSVPIRQQELSFPLYHRAIKPALGKTANLMSKYIPVAREAVLAKKLIEAGNPGKIAPRELMVIKYLLASGGAMLFWFLAQTLDKNTSQAILLSMVGISLGWLMPDLILNSKIKRRKEEVQKNLPDVLDLLTVSVEAGLGFDGALMKVVEKTKGVLADEFVQVLQEAKMGKPRREALRDMADRVGVNDLSNFVGSIILADQLGISIGNVLRLQSREMRSKRRQRAEETAMKAPVKMLIPMVLFIFPAIFVILLGPAVLQIMKVFGS
ncbi:MAG: type II secretion system F family protein [Firmicutes bacterium]|nr:type II secretion system F family protein [Bacillota bacterium]